MHLRAGTSSFLANISVPHFHLSLKTLAHSSSQQPSTGPQVIPGHARKEGEGVRFRLKSEERLPQGSICKDTMASARTQHQIASTFKRIRMEARKDAGECATRDGIIDITIRSTRVILPSPVVLSLVLCGCGEQRVCYQKCEQDKLRVVKIIHGGFQK